MSNPILTSYIRLDGVDKANAQLKALEAQGNKAGAAMSGRSGGGGGWMLAAQQGLTALAVGWAGVTLAIKPALNYMIQAAAAAREDEASVVRRNVAVQAAAGFTADLTKALDAQADSYSKVFGIADDVTRKLQTQYAVAGVNAKSIETMTTATLAFSKATGIDAGSAVVKITKFLQGQTNTIKGTTIAVKDAATLEERWAALMSGPVNTGLEMLAQGVHTGAGAAERFNVAGGEFKESLGRLANTKASVDGINMLADALNGISDWVNTHGEQVQSVLLATIRLGMSSLLHTPFQPVPAYSPSGITPGYFNGPLPTPKLPDGGGGGGKHKGARPKELHPWAWRTGDFGAPSGSMFDMLQLAFMGNMGGTNQDVLSLAGGGTAAGMLGMTRQFQGGLGGPQGAMARALAMGSGGWNFGRGGIFGGITGTAAGLAHGGTDYMAMLGHAFNQQGMAGILGGFAGGGLKGGIGSALSLAGGAVGGPIGSLLGGLIGGGLGKLFGGGHKRHGETPAQPVYTQDVNLASKLDQLLNITKQSLIRGAGGGIDQLTAQVKIARAMV